MIYAAIILLMMAWNHIRGGAALFGKKFGDFLNKITFGRGRLLYWVTPFVGLTSLLVLSPFNSLLMMIFYFFWGVFAWAHWFTLERFPDTFPNREMSWPEKIINTIGFGNDYVCFTIRNFLCSLPLVYFSPWFLLFGPIQTLLYEIGWRTAAYLKKDSGIPYSEVLTGALWGLVIILASIL